MPDLSLKNLKHKFWGTSRRSFGCMKEAQRRERNRHTESRRGDGKKFWVLFETTQSSAWRRQWHPTPALLPGKSHGQRSPVGCSPWGREESDTTEQLPFHFSLSCIGEEMATHSSVLAWRTPGMGEPGGLLSMGSHRVGHNWSDLAAAAEAT